MSLDDDTIRWLADKCTAIVLAAIDRDMESVADTVVEVGTLHDDQGVYALCCGLAKAVAVMGRLEHQVGFHGLKVFHTETGEPVDPRDAPPEVARAIKGAQFVTAHLNGDTELMGALFTADPIAVTAGLTNLVGIHGRHRKAENAGEVKAEASKWEHRHSRHGWPCCEAAAGPPPAAVAKCGGPGLCSKCRAELVLCPWRATGFAR